MFPDVPQEKFHAANMGGVSYVIRTLPPRTARGVVAPPPFPLSVGTHRPRCLLSAYVYAAGHLFGSLPFFTTGCSGEEKLKRGGVAVLNHDNSSSPFSPSCIAIRKNIFAGQNA